MGYLEVPLPTCAGRTSRMGRQRAGGVLNGNGEEKDYGFNLMSPLIRELKQWRWKSWSPTTSVANLPIPQQRRSGL